MNNVAFNEVVTKKEEELKKIISRGKPISEEMMPRYNEITRKAREYLYEISFLSLSTSKDIKIVSKRTFKCLEKKHDFFKLEDEGDYFKIALVDDYGGDSYYAVWFLALNQL